MPDLGIGESIAAGLGALGVGAETSAIAAPILAGVGEGAIGGGAISGLTGGNIGKGALGGAITGGFIPAGGEAFGGALGTTAADALGGAVGGGLSGIATGANPLTSALEGGAAGGISGLLSSSSGGSPTDSSASTNPTAAPSNVPASTPTAGNLGGGSPGGASAPGGITPDSGDVTNQISQGLGGTPSLNTGTPLTNVSSQVNNTGELSATGSPATSSNLPGTPGVGAPNAGLTGGAPSLDTSGIDSLASASQAASAASDAAAKAPNSFGQFIDNPSLGNLGNIATSNPGALISAAGLGLDALRGTHETAADKAIVGQAEQLGGQGAQLENYLQTGTLPAGEQAGVNQALQSAIASIKSRYASMGMSGSSAEQQDIANAQSQAQAQAAQMQEQLLSTGINETGMSSQLYDNLLKNSMANDTNLSNAIASFASAASGGGQNINLSSLLQKTGAGGNA